MSKARMTLPVNLHRDAWLEARESGDMVFVKYVPDTGKWTIEDDEEAEGITVLIVGPNDYTDRVATIYEDGSYELVENYQQHVKTGEQGQFPS